MAMATQVLNMDDEMGPQMDDAEILEEIVRKFLVADHDEVRVEEQEGEQTRILTIHVPAGGRGRIIGTQGKNINLIRGLFSIFGATQNKRILIELAGDSRFPPAPQGKHNFQPRRARRP
jgi:predicted RNA-binding protein YlqC (UPF0109 family)